MLALRSHQLKIKKLKNYERKQKKKLRSVVRKKNLRLVSRLKKKPD